MNVLTSSFLRPLKTSLWVRPFSVSAGTFDKYHKIIKISKPIDTNVYKAGDEVPKGKHIPYFKKQYPDYAYEALMFKRQNRGLYGGLQRKRSKTCSSNGKNKNLRAHLPNVVKSKLWSESLGKSIQTRVTTSVLRTITKEGGLDNYLTKDKPARVKTLGLKGWKLRYDVLKQKQINENSQGESTTVFHIDSQTGSKIVVGRNQLLKLLYPYVFKDNYTPIPWNQFVRSHTVLTTQELLDRLRAYSFDFSQISL